MTAAAEPNRGNRRGMPPVFALTGLFFGGIIRSDILLAENVMPI
jgi:hypothetical protein